MVAEIQSLWNELIMSGARRRYLCALVHTNMLSGAGLPHTQHITDSCDFLLRLLFLAGRKLIAQRLAGRRIEGSLLRSRGLCRVGRGRLRWQ